MIILSGPSGPKFMADAFVVSEKVGDGGPGELVRFGEMAKERSERALGMLMRARMASSSSSSVKMKEERSRGMVSTQARVRLYGPN